VTLLVLQPFSFFRRLWLTFQPLTQGNPLLGFNGILQRVDGYR
jgi:hypothetical protein